MTKTVFAAVAAMVMLAGATTADARPSREVKGEHWNPFVQYSSSVADEGRAVTKRAKRSRYANEGRARRVASEKRAYRRYASRGETYDAGSAYEARPTRRASRRHVATGYTGGSYSGGVGGRPRAWCGWWMRTQRGGGPELNLAWNWSRWGRPSGPQVGAVVVWRHHVGEIVGRASNGQWLVRSGNDGGAVRTRARSVSGAVFRMG
jgi:hypothetical protein